MFLIICFLGLMLFLLFGESFCWLFFTQCNGELCVALSVFQFFLNKFFIYANRSVPITDWFMMLFQLQCWLTGSSGGRLYKIQYGGDAGQQPFIFLISQLATCLTPCGNLYFSALLYLLYLFGCTASYVNLIFSCLCCLCDLGREMFGFLFDFYYVVFLVMSVMFVILALIHRKVTLLTLFSRCF